MADCGVGVTTVDGVRVLHESVDGPLRAVLLFRVGQADETLSIRGVTHLVEHLALSTTNRGPHAYNGATGSIFTSFVVAGEQAEVVGHLEQVCQGLGQLPLDRLDHERGILKTEAAQGGGGTASKSLAAWRWGPRGHGLLGFDELGLDGLTTQAVAGWARRWFTRDNAVLWLSGAIPPDLRLPLLGPQRDVRRDLPSTASVVDVPASYTHSPRGVAMSYLVPRQAAGPALLYILQKRLQTRLRDQLGISYGVQATLDPLGASQSQHLLIADCLPENSSRLQEQFLDVVSEVVAKPPTAAELAEFLAVANLGEHDSASRTLGHLDYIARQLLLEGPTHSLRELREEREALRPEDVHRVANEMAKSLLIAVPDATNVSTALAPPSPSWSTSVVGGTVYSAAPERQDQRLKTLILGDDGVSITTDDGAVTVMFDSCAAMMRYSDGGRTLIGYDGFVARFRPIDWVSAERIAEYLDSKVPAENWLLGAPAARGSSTAAPVAPAAPTKRRLRLGWRRRGVVIATLFAIGGIARLVDGTGGSDGVPGSGPSGLSDISGLIGTSFVDGECLLDGSGGTGLNIQVSCTAPHAAEVVTSAPLEGVGDQQGLDLTCHRAAQQLLTKPALKSVSILAIQDATGSQVVCIAMARSGDELSAPLARTHTSP